MSIYIMSNEVFNEHVKNKRSLSCYFWHNGKLWWYGGLFSPRKEKKSTKDKTCKYKVNIKF